MVGIGRYISPVSWRACPALARPPPPTATCSLEFRSEVAEGDGSEVFHKLLWYSAHPSLWSLSLFWLNFLHRHSCRLLLLLSHQPEGPKNLRPLEFLSYSTFKLE